MRGPIRILQHNSIPGDLPPIFNDRKSLKNLCLKAASAEHLINAEDEAEYYSSQNTRDIVIDALSTILTPVPSALVFHPPKV